MYIYITVQSELNRQYINIAINLTHIVYVTQDSCSQLITVRFGQLQLGGRTACAILDKDDISGSEHAWTCRKIRVCNVPYITRCCYALYATTHATHYDTLCTLRRTLHTTTHSTHYDTLCTLRRTLHTTAHSTHYGTLYTLRRTLHTTAHSTRSKRSQR